jgi:hypothetical protein
MVMEQTQVHRAYLVRHLTPYDESYQEYVGQLQRSLTARFALGALHQTAEGLVNSMAILQASILAYIDVFSVTSAAALAMVPVVFLLRPLEQVPSESNRAPRRGVSWLDAGARHQLTANHYKPCSESGSRSSAPGGNRLCRTNSSSI